MIIKLSGLLYAATSVSTYSDHSQPSVQVSAEQSMVSANFLASALRRKSFSQALAPRETPLPLDSAPRGPRRTHTRV